MIQNCFLLLSFITAAQARSQTDTTNFFEATTTMERENDTKVTEKTPVNVRVIFSDVDGTLVHYPSVPGDKPQDHILKLPPSATGMQGIISTDTLVKCQQLRKGGRKLVLISGMRTSTLLKRIPFLPRADAYCCEAGGRIFYPSNPDEKGDSSVAVGSFELESFEGADKSVLTPFELIEDNDWRNRIQEAAGPDGYASVPYLDRKGLLWDFARTLTDKGFVLDTTGYSSCFRVNRKQQRDGMEEAFEALLSGSIEHPLGLATSTNLGCIDYYPIESGKKNCCIYLGKRFCEIESDLVLKNHAVCLCDDDNDLEMALACSHAYIPDVSSASMAQVIERNPVKFTVTGGLTGDFTGTAATDKALDILLERLHIADT